MVPAPEPHFPSGSATFTLVSRRPSRLGGFTLLVFFGAIVQSVMALAIFFAILYAFVKAALGPVHEKLDRMIASQADLVSRIAALERDKVRL